MTIPLINLKDNITIPQLGFGTWQLKGKECTQAVKNALEIGYTHIDTAEIYENQKAIAPAIENINRDKLFITSKVWRERLKAGDVQQSIEETLGDLGVEYVDLLLVHWPNKDVPIRETLTALKQVQEKGLARAIGVSNFTIKHLKEALAAAQEVGVTINVNQVEYHPGLNQQELLDYCKNNDIVITAYSPLARGKLSRKLKEIGKKYDKSDAQVALRWIIQKGIVAIPKASSIEHQEENMNIWDFSLADEEMEQIDALGDNDRLISPRFAEF